MTILELDYARMNTQQNQGWPIEEKVETLPRWELKRNKAKRLREEADKLEKEADMLEKYEKDMVKEYGI